MLGAMGAALSALLLAAGTASAAWEPAKQVDNQGASAGAPGNYSLLMSTLPVAGGVTDPQVAFDRAGTGYAVAGVGQGASNDEPIRISTYSPSTGAWTKAAPISTQVSSAAGTGTCPG